MRTEEWRTGDHEVIFPKQGPGLDHARKGRKTRRRGRKKEKSWELKQGSCELCALTLHAYSSTASNQVLLQPNQALPTKPDTANFGCYLDSHCVYCAGVAAGESGGLQSASHTDSSIDTSSRTYCTGYRIKVALSVVFNTDHLYSQSIRA